MIGLADFAHPHTRSWEEAERAFTWPEVTEYNIAADCLHADAAKTAIIAVDGEQTIRLTFGELDDLSARLGAGLRSLGVVAGDRVAVKLAQSAPMAVAAMAVLRIGAILLPMSNTLGEDAIRHRLEDATPRVVICAGTPRELSLAAEAHAIVVTTGSHPSDSVRKGRGPRNDDGAVDRGMAGPATEVLTWEELLGRVSEAAHDFAATTPDTPALLLYTSGTTGASKGVLHGHRVVLGHHPADLVLDHVRVDDVAYTPVDWAWAGGMLVGLLVPLALGLTVVAFRDTHFDADRTIAVLRENGVSVGLFPPTALRMLRRSGRLTADRARDLRLRSIITGTEAVEPELADWARDELGVSINDAYGQTEANMLIGHSAVLEPLAHDCLGRAYPGHEIAVLDADLALCPPGVAGELAVRASDPVCMLRYWNAPEATARTIRGGWLMTGDAAVEDEDRQIYFHGRTDDIIKSGGYRIGPAEVEAAILLDDAVLECGAVGGPDPVRGQAVTAYVKLADGHTGGEELTKRLQTRVREKVGAYAYPRIVRYVDVLPRTSAGKVDRNALRRTAAEEAGHDER